VVFEGRQIAASRAIEKSPEGRASWRVYGCTRTDRLTASCGTVSELAVAV